jgi:hypothetical protein
MKNTDFRKYNVGNKATIFIFSICISLLINLLFIDLSVKNFNNNNVLYPSVTTVEVFEHLDIDENLQWVRRSHENNSIFKLSANIYEDKKKQHFQSSRGLAYYLSSIGLKISNNSLYAITITKIIFIIVSMLLFVVIGKLYIKNHIDIIAIILLTIIFSNKLFGGILNFYHFIEYFSDIVGFYGSSGLDRIPNILIQNVFVLLNFYVIKMYFLNNSLKNLIYAHITLVTSIFITPIIFIVYSGLLFSINSLIYFNNKNLKDFFIKTSILSIIFLLSLIFHYKNLTLINDSSLNSPQWTGNYLYDLEIFLGPIILLIIFFTKLKKYFLELAFFSIQLVFFVMSFFYDIYLSTKINENFIFINTFLTFLLLIKLTDLNFKDVRKKLLYFGVAIFYTYLFLQHGLDYKILLTLLLVPIYLIFRYMRDNFYMKYALYLMIFSFFAFFNINDYLIAKKKHNYNNNTEISQLKLIEYLNKNNLKKKTIISLDLGVLKNLSIHTNNNVYFANITSTNLNMMETKKRFYDIIYLYGFSTYDFKDYLKIFRNKDLLNKQYVINFDDKNFDYQEKSSIIFYRSIFHLLAINSKQETETFINQYELYLKNKENNNHHYYDTCLISNYDEKLIQKDSFFYEINQKKPIYKNNFIKLYEC